MKMKPIRYALIAGILFLGELSASTLPGPQDFEILSEGHVYLEGPSWSDEGQFLVFVDQSANKLWKWDSENGAVLLRSYEGKINGTVFDAEGRLLLCESAERRINRITFDGDQLIDDILIDNIPNEPNDIVLHSNGTIWFTTPHFGGNSTDSSQQNVYRFEPQTQQLDVIYSSFSKPNGLAFSPDESVLYVALYSGNRVTQIPLDASGNTNGSPTELARDLNRGPDGLKVDDDGNIYVMASANEDKGIVVFDSEGNRIGQIRIPESSASPTNLFFTDDALFVTGGTILSKANWTGFPKEPHAELAKTESVPLIDGFADDLWLFAEDFPLRHPMPIWRMLDENDIIPSEDDLAAEVKVLWDDTNLYLFASITDETPQAPYTETWFFEDTFELYLDADRLNAPPSGEFDGLNDWEIGIHALADPIVFILGDNSVNSTAGFVGATQLTAKGYDLELAFPWSTLGASESLGDGYSIGIDFHIIDNDNQIERREHKLAWFGSEDEAWRDTRIYGAAVLREESAFSLFTQFPAPFHEILGTADEGGAWVHGRRFARDWIWVHPDHFPWVYHVKDGWSYVLIFNAELWAYLASEESQIWQQWKN